LESYNTYDKAIGNKKKVHNNKIKLLSGFCVYIWVKDRLGPLSVVTESSGLFWKKNVDMMSIKVSFASMYTASCPLMYLLHSWLPAHPF
jgi:hypothetical protein